MKLFKNMGGFLGYTIGAIVVLPLLLIVYNYFLINKNDGQKYISSYIKDSGTILLTIPFFDESNIKNDHVVQINNYTISMASKNMGRDGSKKTTLNYRLVYNSDLKKYFKIVMFDLVDNFWDTIDSKTVYGKVNNRDLQNPELGTRENPILIFSIEGLKGPLIEKDMEGKSVDYKTSFEQYHYNVFMYLTYIMPKQEFKIRFEKEKL